MKITVEIADRVDKALARQFPEAGRRQLSQLFDEGCVRVAGKLAKKGDRVAAGDEIELSREPVSGDALRPAPDPDASARIAILLERPDIVVINKPAGMPSQPLRAGELGTAANAIVHRYPECVAIGDDARDGGLVHRLDIGTSGVLVAARTPEAYRALRDAFGAGLVDKQYLAITDGRPVSRECDAPLVQRGKRVIVDHTDGLAAFTAFTVEQETEAHALVRCVAQTGRMHQVRAHLAHVGSPITGDELYKGAPLPGFDGFFLHAARIVLPIGGEPVTIEAPPPERFVQALAACKLT
ncbi:MAG: RluA family pseudouridine synthase [Deltaproteobacteria bacterium]|nr:RluA family pseudouridine synthase [Deltaproteobacteria bacterium]MDQ3296540.1 RluA family pseudouridine synthase [Myxococcota bacterium]